MMYYKFLLIFIPIPNNHSFRIFSIKPWQMEWKISIQIKLKTLACEKGKYIC
jgi:hypothetical protein